MRILWLLQSQCCPSSTCDALFLEAVHMHQALPVRVMAHSKLWRL